MYITNTLEKYLNKKATPRSDLRKQMIKGIILFLFRKVIIIITNVLKKTMQ